MAEDLISRHDQSLVFHQILKKFKFLTCQFDLFALPADFVLSDRQCQILTFQFFVVLLSGSAAQDRLYSGDKFHHSKRFCDIIIGSCFQPADLVKFGFFCRDHDHRDIFGLL